MAGSMSHWVFRQLGKSLDLTRSTGRGAPATAAIVERQKMPEDLPAQHMLVRARAVSAAVAAEQAWRKLNLDTRKLSWPNCSPANGGTRSPAFCEISRRAVFPKSNSARAR